jgi:serine/threonine-protein kinase
MTTPSDPTPPTGAYLSTAVPPPTAPTAELPAAPPGYSIEGVLGQGGMGVVYRARQLRRNRSVALKMVLIGAHSTPEQRLRFLAEAEVLAKLQPPHIVQVYDCGGHQEQPFFALECPRDLDMITQRVPL